MGVLWNVINNHCTTTKTVQSTMSEVPLTTMSVSYGWQNCNIWSILDFKKKLNNKEGRKKMFYLMMHSHFINAHIILDMW